MGSSSPAHWWWWLADSGCLWRAAVNLHRRLIIGPSLAVGRPRPAVEPMSRPDYGPTAVAYGGPLSTYMDGSSAAHRRLMEVARPRPAVEPMSRPDYGPTAVAYGGPLSTYMDGSSAAHRRLKLADRGPLLNRWADLTTGRRRLSTAGRCQLTWTVRQRPIVGWWQLADRGPLLNRWADLTTGRRRLPTAGRCQLIWTVRQRPIVGW